MADTADQRRQPRVLDGRTRRRAAASRAATTAATTSTRPRRAARGAWSDDVAPTRSADAAASTRTRSTERPWSPGIEVPYVIAIVELDEQSDLRLMTNVVGCEPDEVAIDMPVRGRVPRAGRRVMPRVQAGMTMADSFEQRCIISGIGQSEVGRRVTRGVMALTLDAVPRGDRRRRPGACGHRRRGLVARCGHPRRGSRTAAAPDRRDPVSHAVIDALRLDTNWYYGGPETPGMLAAVIQGCMAVASGMCRHVLVYRALNEATAWRTNTRSASPPTPRASPATMQWILPFGAFSGPNWMGALRHAATCTSTARPASSSRRSA